MLRFMPGLTLSRILFDEAVQPLMVEHVPNLSYAAGLFGHGSDVLGYDTARSMDHDWGPRLILMLNEGDWDAWSSRLDKLFRQSLPRSIGGFPTGTVEFETEPGIRHMIHADDGGPIDHLITITTVGRWLGAAAKTEIGAGASISLPDVWLAGILSSTGVEPEVLDPGTWITLPQQWLLETISGEVFRDDIGAITNLRAALTWYPDDVWRYLMAAQWMRIDQSEPFIGRTGEVGDDLGSHLVAMTLVRDAMRLAFLLEQRYAPYPKWFGTGFRRLQLAGLLTPHLDQARFATSWQERERGLVEAVVALAKRHNELKLTRWLDPAPRPFHDRAFTIVGGARFSSALLETIRDPEVRALPPNVGGIDQYLDSTDALVNGALHRAIRIWMGA
ncbi:MAG: DUF4037 domain-containing protein [Chloroflexota bacterium]|nr:DUF4037 domain-containing protein [Chloroflexota bacterium]